MNAIFNSANLVHPAPEVGMGGTIFMASDRHAFTVVRVSKSGKTAWIQEDKAIRTDKNGMSESQTYNYEAQPQASVQEVRLCSNGQWYRGGQKGTKVAFGHREAYHNFSY